MIIHFIILMGRFQVESMGIPDVKCRVSIVVNGEKVDLTIDDLY